jgi:hypothetical protein
VRYVRIRTWEKHQSVTHRGATFVKLYTKALRDSNYAELTDAQRGQFTSLLLFAAVNGNVLEAKAKTLGRLAMCDGPIDLDALLASGLLEPMTDDEAQAEIDRLDEFETDRAAKRAAAGRKGGQVKSTTSEANAKRLLSDGLADAKQTPSNPEASAKPIEGRVESIELEGNARARVIPPLSAGAVGRIDALRDVAARRREFYCSGADKVLDIDGHRSLVERDNRAELEALARSHPAEFMRHSQAFIAGGAKVEKLGKARGRCFGLLRHLCYDDTGEAEGPGEGEAELRRAALEKLRAMPHKTAAEIFG